MTPAAFRKTLSAAEPPASFSGLLRALWHGARGDWARAHEIVQGETGADVAWVHAWLHRIEGDLDNARYWYGRAGRSERSGPTDEELGEILTGLLSHSD